MVHIQVDEKRMIQLTYTSILSRSNEQMAVNGIILDVLVIFVEIEATLMKLNVPLNMDNKGKEEIGCTVCATKQCIYTEILEGLNAFRFFLKQGTGWRE